MQREEDRWPLPRLVELSSYVSLKCHDINIGCNAVLMVQYNILISFLCIKLTPAANETY